MWDHVLGKRSPHEEEQEGSHTTASAESIPAPTPVGPTGVEWELRPWPHVEVRETRGSRKLQTSLPLLLAGYSGIGRAVSLAFAREGAGHLQREFVRVDILVNNAAKEHRQNDLAKITAQQLRKTIETTTLRGCSSVRH